MAKIKLFLAALGLFAATGCTVETAAAPPPDGEAQTAAWLAAIPAQCFAHLGKEYLGRAVECTPGAEDSATCGLDSGQKQTPLDGSGNPMVFLCNCMSDHLYSCLYVGAEAAWKNR